MTVLSSFRLGTLRVPAPIFKLPTLAMMHPAGDNPPVQPLTLTALSIGFLHTLLGPDHYVPFVAMARAGKWSYARLMTVTALCGLAHVCSSAALGLIGVTVGFAVFRLNAVESVRANIAGWLLVAFGFAYTVWGIRAAIRNRPHSHVHAHDDGTVHAHTHSHHDEHAHVHAPRPDSPDPSPRSIMTAWALFTIFVFGPCEPLIPLVMYPAAKGSLWDVAAVTAWFGAVTLITMCAAVSILHWGAKAARFDTLQRFTHAAAGVAILACGVAVKCGL